MHHPYTLILLQRERNDRLWHEADAMRRGAPLHPRWPRRRLPQFLRVARTG